MQFQIRAHDDDRATRIIHTFTKQVTAEPPLLALEQVAKRFELAFAAAANSSPATSVINEAIDSFLQHALLVAHNHIGSAQFQQTA